ncbi:cob(I)yrinic acid a,c-diamide adenosyltransferase [Vulgatibacter incomptus]|uniref:Corrinoid adenosyltransferase n=1 Tax=Vulgatibacter incomptus TaxID=1391653 RepID=A0A0K1P9B8_9BACT|nr:cob(I)yrinic acid a,c-diamide adenosyltransferase [Vulgatibacter incomptus]AKU90115.1 ATP:Cob(I)alamin adenosyltransferase [Vulgatibacter incomptus]
MTFHIYTKTGDKGQTGLFGGGRVRKDDPRVEAYGAVDELNAALGIAEAEIGDEAIKGWIKKIQDELFVVGAELSTPDPDAVKRQVVPVGPDQVSWMESTIDTIDAEVPPLRQFVLPGGHRGAAHLHLARTICRRAERRVLTFSDHAEVRTEVITYLNRLSDLLFMLARLVNHRSGIAEPVWNPPLRKG